jgi:hypothetical protein
MGQHDYLALNHLIDAAYSFQHKRGPNLALILTFPVKKVHTLDVSERDFVVLVRNLGVSERKLGV